MKLFSKVLVLLTLVNGAIAYAGSFGEPFESEVKESIRMIQEGHDNRIFMDRVIGIWLTKQKNCKIGGDNTWCPIRECDIDPKKCRGNRTILFRGESKKFTAPATSALWRSVQNGSSFADNISLFGVVQKLEDERQSEDQEFRKTHPDYVNSYNFRQSYFEKHAEAQEPIEFFDTILKKEVDIDPLISFSVNPIKAMSFSEPSQGKSTGRVIVLSVPRKNVRSLCPKALPLPGDIIETLDCGKYLNEYDDETEVDAFLYVKPEYIWKVFN